MTRLFRPIVCTAWLLLCSSGFSATKSWIDPAGGDWSDDFNWAPTGAPGFGDAAVFNIFGFYTVRGSFFGDEVSSVTVRNGDVRFESFSAGFTPSLLIDGGDASFEITMFSSFRQVTVRSGELTIATSGTFSAGSSRTDVDFGGQLIINSFSRYSCGGVSVFGTVRLHGRLSSSGFTHDITSVGQLRGSGEVDGADLQNSGTVRPEGPGSVIGTLSVGVKAAGNFVQASLGRLEIQLAGKTAGTGYDVLRGGGTNTAKLAGTLQLVLTGGFLPALSDEFVIIDDFAAIEGTFATVTGLPSGFGVFYNQTNSQGKRCVKVRRLNSAPVAVADSAQAKFDPIEIDVLANDSDPESNPLSLVSAGPASSGTVAVEGNKVQYTPPAGGLAKGATATFGYTVSDGTDTATAQVTVTGANSPPVANPDGAFAAYTTVGVAVINNDSDPDSDALSVSAVGTPTLGTAEIVDGVVRYTPPPGGLGAGATATFAYTLSDGAATAIGNVTVTGADPLTSARGGTFSGGGQLAQVKLRFSRTRSASGTINIAGIAYRGLVLFGPDGRATGEFSSRAGKQPVVFELSVNSAGEFVLTGRIGEETSLALYPAAFSRTNPVPLEQAGLYNLLLPASPTGEGGGPGGSSVAWGKLLPDGSLRILGKLADTSAFTTSTAILADTGSGDPIFYLDVPLYTAAARGFLHIDGTMTLDNPADDLVGNVNWFKPPQTKGLYAAGFSYFGPIRGSRYVAPVEGIPAPFVGPVANLRIDCIFGPTTSSGRGAYSGGNFKLLSATPEAPNDREMTLHSKDFPTTGRYSGKRSTGPGVKSFLAVILQKSGIVEGFVISGDGTQTGRAVLVQEP